MGVSDTARYAEGVADMGWWVIHGESLLDMLRRCHQGESPDLVYAEEYANCDHDTEA